MSLEVPPGIEIKELNGPQAFAQYINEFGTSEERLRALDLVALPLSQAISAYNRAVTEMIRLVDHRSTIVDEGKATTPEYLLSVKAVGLAGNILAQTIDAQYYAEHQTPGRKRQIPPRTNELYMEAQKRHGKHLIVVTGLFDFFGRLYRREVAQRYGIGSE